MPRESFSDKINRHFRENEWAAARKLLDREIAKEPGNHWLLTQLGVTHYEERHYKKAMDFFLQSRKILPSCPLTLWNLAGALDALGKPHDALSIYTSLLECEATFAEDPCWESQEWTAAVKTDCVFAIGKCFQQLDNQVAAEHCFRQYIDLLLNGIEGTYSIEEARHQIQSLRSAHQNGANTDVQLRKIKSYLAKLKPAVKGDKLESATAFR